MNTGPHPSHKTRFSDASTFDVICVNCGATDEVPGGWGQLAYPCPKEVPKEEVAGMKPKAELTRETDGFDYLMFWCRGCDTNHRVPVTGPKAWTWNGSLERPTISPSIRIDYGNGKICHSVTTDGRILYCSDCTHALVGQTVDLESNE